MTNRSYYQFETRSCLRRFFTLSGRVITSEQKIKDRPGCRMRHRSLQSGTQFQPRLSSGEGCELILRRSTDQG